MSTTKALSIVQRVKAPTPVFFKKLRVAGLAIAAAGGALAATPVALPVIIAKVAGYLVVAGSVISAVSQTTVVDNPQPAADE